MSDSWQTLSDKCQTPYTLLDKIWKFLSDIPDFCQMSDTFCEHWICLRYVSKVSANGRQCLSDGVQDCSFFSAHAVVIQQYCAQLSMYNVYCCPIDWIRIDYDLASFLWYCWWWSARKRYRVMHKSLKYTLVFKSPVFRSRWWKHCLWWRCSWCISMFHWIRSMTYHSVVLCIHSLKTETGRGCLSDKIFILEILSPVLLLNLGNGLALRIIRAATIQSVGSCIGICFFFSAYLQYSKPKYRNCRHQGAVSIRKTVLPGVVIPMLKIRRPNGRLIFNMEIAIRR